MAEVLPKEVGNDVVETPPINEEDFSIFDAEEPSSIFDPIEVTTEVDVVPPVSDKVTESLLSSFAEDVQLTGSNNEDAFSVATVDKGAQADERESRIEMELLKQDTLPIDKIKAAQDIMKERPVPRTLGEMAAAKDPAGRPGDQQVRTAARFDEAARIRENKEIQKLALGGEAQQEWEDFIRQRNEGIVEYAVKAKRNAKEAGSDIINEWDEVDSIQTFFEFINVKEVPDSMDIDAGLMVDSILDDFTLGPQFNDAMKSKYGPEWENRMAWFLAKEVGVDVALLMLAAAYPPLAILLFAKHAARAGKAVKLGNRMRMAVGRATLLGVGGGTIQSGINVITGDDPDLLFEVGMRFGAELGGEALLKGVSFGLKGIKKGLIDSRKGAAGRLPDSKVFDHRTANVFKNSETGETDSLSRGLIEGSMWQLSKQYGKVVASISNGVASKDALDPIRKTASQLTNIPEADLDLKVLFASDMFKNIEKVIKPAIDSKTGKVIIDEFGDVQHVLTTKGEALGKKKLKSVLAKSKKVTKTESAKKKRLEKSTKAAKTASNKFRDPKKKAPFETIIKENKIKLRVVNRNLDIEAERLADLERQATTGSPMVDNIIVNQGMGFRAQEKLIYGQMQNNQIFTTQYNISTFSHGTEPSALPGNKDIGKAMGAFHLPTLLSDPETFIGTPAQSFLHAINRSEQSDRVFSKMLANAMPISIMTRKQRNAVWDVLQQGSDAGKRWQTVDLDGFGLNPIQQEAYRAVRSTLDVAHYAHDRIMVRELTQETLKDGSRAVMRFQDRIVNVSKTANRNLTEGDIADGFVEVTEVLTKNLRSGEKPFTKVIKFGELDPDLKSVVPYDVGYIPRIYKDAKFFVGIIDTATGAYRRVAASGSRADHFDILKRLEDGETIEGVALTKTEKAFAGEWDEVFQRGAVGFDSRSLNAIDAAPPKAKALFKAALDKAGFSERQVRLKLDKMDGADLRRKFIGEKGVALLGDAKIMETKKATANMLQAVAVKNGTNDWRRHTTDWFENKYASVMEGRWFEDADKAFKARGAVRNEAEAALRAEGVEVHSWLKRSVLQTTKLEATLEKAVAEMSVRMAGHPNKYMRLASSIVDKSPRMRQWNNIARGFPATTKLLFMNFGMITVQGSQMIATIGSRPIHAARGMVDMMDASIAALAEQYGKEVTSGAAQTLSAIKRVGWLSNLDTTDLYNSAGSAKLGVIGRGFNLVSKGPFRMGEGMNRALAFYTTRQEFASLMAAGKFLPGGKVFKGKFDDDEFLRLVVDKAKITALDMGKAGQLKLFSGVGSTVFQFMQVAPKMLNMFTHKGLTPRQRAGAASAMVAMWGASAIPFLPDIMNLVVDPIATATVGRGLPSNTEMVSQAIDEVVNQSAEASAQMIAELPLDEVLSFMPDSWIKALGDRQGVEDFLKRATKKGFLNAATQGEIDLVNRVAVGRMVTDAIRDGSLDDGIIAYTVMEDLFDATVKTLDKAVFSPSWPVYFDLLGKASEGEATYSGAFQAAFGAFPSKLGLQILREWGQAISYVGHATKAISTATRNHWDANFLASEDANTIFTSGGVNTGVVASSGKLWQMLAGLTPGEVKREFQARQMERRLQVAWSEWRNDMLSDFKGATGKTERMKIMAEVMQEAKNMDFLFTKNNLKGNIPADFYGSTIESFMSNLIKQQTGETSILDPLKF